MNPFICQVKLRLLLFFSKTSDQWPSSSAISSLLREFPFEANAARHLFAYSSFIVTVLYPWHNFYTHGRNASIFSSKRFTTVNLLCMQRPSVQFCEWSTVPSQSFPPFLGAGSLHSLLLHWVHSVPQADHLLHSVHTPSTGGSGSAYETNEKQKKHEETAYRA